jgi:small ligand-binding sensory domain FIST
MRTKRRAGVAISTDRDPGRAGVLAAADAASQIGRSRVRAIVVFASGRHSSAIEAVVAGVADGFSRVPIAAVGGAGVITGAGELDGTTATVALVLDFPISADVAPSPVEPAQAEEVGRALGATVAHEPARPALFFAPPSPLTGAVLESISDAGHPSVLVGGGLTATGAAAVHVPEAAVTRVGDLLALRFDGGARLSVGASPAVVPLSEWAGVDRVEDGFVVELGGRPPLAVLNEAMRLRNDRPLVLAALASPRGDGELLVRALSGVNPARGAIFVGPGVSVGDRLAFAALDADAARKGFDSMLQRVHRDLAGGVPLAGFFIDCLGRGASLYGRHGVDARAIRGRFGDLPFAGVRSSFEVAPFAGRPAVHSYTGVVAVLYAPS